MMVQKAPKHDMQRGSCRRHTIKPANVASPVKELTPSRAVGRGDGWHDRGLDVQRNG
jgi:hypothetical protein